MGASESRTALQDRALEKFISGRRLLLEWGTGVGKSRVGVRCAEHVRSVGGSRFLLLIAETTHEENWRREFVEYLGKEAGEELFGMFRVACYASLKKFKDTAWDLVIADEAHHLRSDLRQSVLRTMYSGWFLALSATMTEAGDGDSLLYTMDRTFGPFTRFSYDLSDAIDAGLLPEPVVNIVCPEFTAKARERYDSLCEWVSRAKEEYLDAYDADSPDAESMKNGWMYACMKRKEYLGAVKTWSAKRLIARLTRERKRFIVFCSSVKQIEKLGGKDYILSSRSRKQNNATIERFNSHEVDILYVVGMLQEGQNLRDIDAGIVIQLDSKARRFVQRFGRVMRSAKPEIYIFYMQDTRDDDYLKTALENVDSRFVVWPEELQLKGGFDTSSFTDRKPDSGGFSVLPGKGAEFFFGGRKNDTGLNTNMNTYNNYIFSGVPSVVAQMPSRVVLVKGTYADALLGPWFGPAEMKGYVVRDTRPTMQAIEGWFWGVSVDPVREEVYIYMKVSDGAILRFRWFWRDAVPYLVQLANIGELYHQRMGINLAGVSQNGSLVPAVANVVPAGESELLNFVNCLVDDIVKRFLEGRGRAVRV